MRLYFIALQFLTIIPLPFSVRCGDKDLGRSMAVFPLVGLTLGGLLAGADFFLARLFPRPVDDLLLIFILSVVTGALHLDGLADTCDGVAARGDRERFLAVMKDSRIGAVGVVGLTLGLLLKYQALQHIPYDHKLNVLFFFPMAARFAQVQLTVGSQRARVDGLGAAFIEGSGKAQFLAAGFIYLAATSLLLGLQGVYACVILFLFTWGFKGWFHRKLGGINGDIIGCASELNEIVCLLAIVAMNGNKHLA